MFLWHGSPRSSKISITKKNWKNSKNLSFRIFQSKQFEFSKILSGAEYRMDEQFQNFLIFGILIVFQIKKKI